MLDFLKSLFRQKPKEKQKVDFYELASWLSSKMDFGLPGDFERINEIREKLAKSLSGLEKVDIDSMKVEEKLKGYVRGNRKAYVQSLRMFLSWLTPPEKLDHKSVTNFCRNLDEELQHFNKKTVKNFYMMKNLIGNELEEIRKSLKELDSLLKKVSSKVREKSLELMEDVLSRLRGIYSFLDGKAERDSRLDGLRKKRDSIAKSISALGKEVDDFRKGKSFTELSRLKVERDRYGAEIAKISGRLNNRFAIISRPMRKLAKMYRDKLLESYLKDPCQALLSDTGLKISELLESLKREINAGKIQEKNKEKMVSAIEYLSSKYLSTEIAGIKAAKEGLEKCNSEISANRFEQELSEKTARLTRMEQDLASVDEEITKLSSREIREDISCIEQDLKKLGFEVEVENAPYDG